MKIEIIKLSPTQVAVGYEQVVEKMIVMIVKKKKLKEYLKEHIVPVIKGYNNKLYIIDHHHFCLAAQRIGIIKVYIEIKEDWSNLSKNDFWRKMEESKYIWLYDEKGNSIELEDFNNYLPENICDLLNDPYRSLAGLVRKRKGFNKIYIPFSEFIWANYFRTTDIKLLYDAESRIPYNILNYAIELAKQKETIDLPGHITELS